MTALPTAMSFVTQAWLARRFDRIGLGEYHATSLFIIVLTTIVLFGFPAGASQRIATLEEGDAARARPAKETSFALAGLFGIGLALAGFALWPYFARAFAVPVGPAPLVIALAMVGSVLLTFAQHVHLAELRMLSVAALAVTQPAGVALGIALTYVGLELDPATLAGIGFVAAGAASAGWLLADGLMPRAHRVELASIARRAVPASIALYPTVVTGWIDRAIIGVVVGPSALGAFVAASALVDAVQRFARGFSSFSVPAYARLAADPALARRVLESHLRVTAALFVLAGSVFIAAGSGMLSLIFGEGFGIAGTTLRLLAIALVPLGVALVVGSHAVGMDPLRASSRIIVLLIPMHLVVGTVLTALFSIAGTALANVVVWSIGALLYVSQAQRAHAALPWRPLLHIAGVAVPLAVASWYIGLQPVHWALRALASLLVAVPVVIVILIRDEERRLLSRLVIRGGVTGER